MSEARNQRRLARKHTTVRVTDPVDDFARFLCAARACGMLALARRIIGKDQNLVGMSTRFDKERVRFLAISTPMPDQFVADLIAELTTHDVAVSEVRMYPHADKPIDWEAMGKQLNDYFLAVERVGFERWQEIADEHNRRNGHVGPDGKLH